jgi:hypothetical protein
MLKRPQTTHRVRKGVEPFEMNEAVCEPQLGSRGALNSVKICKKVTSPVRNAWRDRSPFPSGIRLITPAVRAFEVSFIMVVHWSATRSIGSLAARMFAMPTQQCE